MFCNQCNKDFYFDNLPTDRSIFCPDCGSPAMIIDVSELSQRRKNSNIDSSTSLESPTTAKTGQFDPSRTKGTKPYTPPVINQASTTAKTGQFDPSRTKGTKPYRRIRYSRRKALILSSLGAIIGITGISHLYIRTSKNNIKGICFLIGGFFVYLFAIVLLDSYIFHPSAEYPDPDGGGKVGAIFFLIVYILIWLWQFLDIRKLTKFSS